MKTILIKINTQNIDETKIQQAKQFILNHECVAMPTETVYGLAANAFSPQAISRIFEAKGRPSDNPLIVHISDEAMLLDCIDQEITLEIRTIMNAFWPGPLTLVFKKSHRIPDVVSAGLPTVGIRMPNHPIALALIKASCVPLAAPSANISGKPSPTKASHVYDDLNGKIAAIIEADQSHIGVESTVLDVSTSPFTVLRKGGISIEQLQMIDADIKYDDALVNNISTPKSPGQKYKHYAPSKPMLLLEGSLENQLAYLKTISMDDILLISVDEIIQNINVPHYFSLGSRHDFEKAMNGLFEILRESEFLSISSLIVTAFEDYGLGATLNDRLRKAASEKINL
ncbi:MAG: threonylcarbamoyl-AMP synthase [Erysipelothrix sp.]|nr:threonylcarbamoyl-AMP synthase [Erysipelothrix sp.]